MNMSSSVIFTEWNCFLVETFIIGAINSVNRRLEWSTACKREEIREIQFVAVFKFFILYYKIGKWNVTNLQFKSVGDGCQLKECFLVWQRQNAENVWRVLHNKADRTWHWLGSESNKTITKNDFVLCILCKNRQGSGSCNSFTCFHVRCFLLQGTVKPHSSFSVKVRQGVQHQREFSSANISTFTFG